MTNLVDYSDSESDVADNDDDSNGEVNDASAQPAAKKRKVSSSAAHGRDDHAARPAALPPLPASFLDQYSSNVRTSTQDDPALHGGRKRVTPHVEGNWPTHIYLEWHPDQAEAELLNNVLLSLSRDSAKGLSQDGKHQVHSLLQNDLGVPLPLHISLSRPLVLKTAQKDLFLARLTESVSNKGIAAFDTSPKNLVWHANENGTRWFLVLRVHSATASELGKLLDVSNFLAAEYQQPLLYAKGSGPDATTVGGHFHISIAWALEPPRALLLDAKGSPDFARASSIESPLPSKMLQKLGSLSIPFSDIKLRIGQDVHTLPLKARRHFHITLE